MSSPAVDPRELYLALLKKSLTFTLWPEPPVRLAELAYQLPPVRRGVFRALDRILSWWGCRLVLERPTTDDDRQQGKFWPAYAHTMVGLKRLDNLQQCLERVLADGIEGDVLEAGVWRGGASIFMRGVLAAHGVTDRRVFVADSFRGLPPPSVAEYPADLGDDLHRQNYLAVPQSEVADNFRKYGLLDENVVFLEGWFKDTLPQAPIERLALLRLDGDMYGSTMETLTVMYPKLSVGGYCIIDDYALETCRRAIHDYRAAEGIDAPVEQIDWTGAFWRKTSHDNAQGIGV